MAVDWDTWQQQMRQGGFGTTAIPGLPDTGMSSPALTWSGWELGQSPQQQGTMYNPGTGASPYAQPAAGEWTSGGTFGTRYSGPAEWNYAQQGPPPSTPSGIDPTYATGNYPQETTYTIPGNPNTFGQPNAAALAPVVAAGQAAQQAAQQAKTGTGQSGQEQVNNAPKVASAGTVTLKPPDQRTRRSDQTAQEAGYNPSDPSFRPDFTFQNGQLRLRWSTYQEGINSRILRTMAAGIKERGLGEEAAYQAAVNEALGYVNSIGAPDDSFVILPYQVFQGAARAYGDAGFKRDALWGTYGKQFNTIDAANNGDAAYDPNYGLAVTPVYGRGAAPQGGTNVSAAPGLDPGAGGGGTVPGQTPGAGNPLMNEALASNQALRTAMLLEKLGIGSPMARRNMFTGGVGQRVSQVMDPWMKTQGLQGGDPQANIEGLLNQMAGYFGQGGGGMGRIASDARTAAQQAVGDSRYTGLPDDEMLAMLTGFNQLANLPQNPWMQRAYGNLQDELAAQYASFNLQPGKLGSTDILGYIKDNPLFNFMTGGR